MFHERKLFYTFTKFSIVIRMPIDWFFSLTGFIHILNVLFNTKPLFILFPLPALFVCVKLLLILQTSAETSPVRKSSLIILARMSNYHLFSCSFLLINLSHNFNQFVLWHLDCVLFFKADGKIHHTFPTVPKTVLYMK